MTERFIDIPSFGQVFMCENFKPLDVFIGHITKDNSCALIGICGGILTDKDIIHEDCIQCPHVNSKVLAREVKIVKQRLQTGELSEYEATKYKKTIA